MMRILSAADTKPLEGGPSFSLGNRIFRAAWQFVWLAFAAWTPPALYAWRRALLRCWGANVASTARVYGSARIWYPPHLTMEEFACLGPSVNCYNQAPIRLGRKVTVSQGAHLCAGSHDVSDPNFQLITKPIEIKRFAWIAAEAFVGPGVVVGEGAVLSARGVAFHDLEPWTIYRGNPAVRVRMRERERWQSTAEPSEEPTA